MKKSFVVIFLAHIFALCAFSQASEDSPMLQNLRRNVSYLASDQLAGRRTGETGATFAAGYLANKFAEYRLTAAGGGQGQNFLQSFPYLAGIGYGKNNRLRITDSRELVEFSVQKDWAPVGFSPSAEIPFSDIVFAGFGITSKDNNYDDYDGLATDSKIIIAFDGTPDYDNPHNTFAIFNVHAKALLAKQHGAKGLILISRENNFANDKQAMRFDQTAGETAVPVIIISRQKAQKILGGDDNDLKAMEVGLTSSPSTPPKAFVKKTPKLLADFHIDLIKKRIDSYNVIGLLEGSDPILKNEIIVIGAHYDHLGRGGPGSLEPNSTAIHHGADDNSSGTSALLELAKRYSGKRDNKRSLLFISFGGEEEGLLGSKFFVNNPTVKLESVVAMVNMDMVGRLKDNKLTIGGIGTATEFKNLVESKNLGTQIAVLDSPTAEVLHAQPAPKLFELQLNQDGFGPSDHSSFYSKKIPVLFFFTGTHSDYHKPTDTANLINYSGLEKITNYVASIIDAIGSSTNRPTYAVAPSSGAGEGRRGFSVSLGTIPSYADGTNDGLLLDGVRENSSASQAGIKAGDKIIKLAGKEIRTISDYVFALGEMKPDTEYEIVVTRNGETLDFKITPKKR